MATSSKSRTLQVAFVIDADDRRQLAKLLEDNVLPQVTDERRREITYKVQLSDDSSIDTTSIEDVLSLPNSKVRRMTEIRLSTPYLSSPIRASVRLQNNNYFPISYDLSGDDKEVVSLAYKLDDRLLSFRQWYTLLARYSFFAMFLAVVGLSVLLASHYG